MEQLIIGKTVEGTYYVRPISWAGQWDKEGNLAYGNTLYESEKEADCERYKNIKELLELISENPYLLVVPIVNGEVVTHDDCGYWLGSFGTASVKEYFSSEEHIHFREDNDLDETLADVLEYEKYEEISDEEAEKAFEELPWIKAIVVYIETP